MFRYSRPPDLGMEVNHFGRGLAASWSIITGKRPEIACFGFAAPRIQPRGGGFIHEQFVGSLQVFGQSVYNGLKVEGRLANLIRQHGAVQIRTRPRQDLALSV